MKIAIVNQPMDMIIPPHQNSIGLWTYKIAPHMAKNHQVTVYGKRSSTQRVWHGDNGVKHRFMPPVVPNRVIAERFGGLVTALQAGDLPFYASKLCYLDYILQIANSIRKEEADIVHIHNFTQFVPIVRKLVPEAKIVLHMHGEWLSQLDYATMDRRLEQTDFAGGSSNYIAEKVRRRFPHHTERCGTIYNGVDADLFLSASRTNNGRFPHTKQLLFVGRVSPEKGVHVLVEALEIIVSHYPQVVLNIAGPMGSLPREFIVDVSDDPEITALGRFYEEEDYGTALQRLIPPHLQNKVNFLGSMPQNDLVTHYQNADILINPSFSESFGMSLVEAMASEKPVVATRVGGMVELVEGQEVGILVERNDASALADAILTLLRDETQCRTMGQNGRRRALDVFSWPQVAKRALANYARLLKVPAQTTLEPAKAPIL